MTASDLTARVTAALEPQVAAHGLELVAVERVGGRGTPVLRVLLDREGGIDLEAIASANRWVSDVLDELDPIGTPYTLEVSSPGIDRPLTKRTDFERFVDEPVTLKFTTAGKRHTKSGVLLGMDGDDVLLDAEGERVAIQYETIQKARLKGVVDFRAREGEPPR